MALTANVQLLNNLPDVVLTGNKIPLQFQASENLIETEGTNAEIILNWTDFALVDEYFDLLLFGETVRFTCKAVPDNSGIQFHNNNESLPLEEWVAILAEDLKRNYLIARYYDVAATLYSYDITLTAKEKGADYTLEFTAGPGINCTPTETNKTGIDETYRAFYGIVVLLYCNDEFVTELILNVDNEGLAEVDVSELLKPYISQDFEWPESDSNFIFDRSASIASWYFRYGERWGDSDYKALALSDIYYAINGGVSWMQQAKYNAETSSFWEKLQYNKYFLSWAPLTRYIGPEEPVKLYFINHTAATSLKLKAKLYTSSTNSTITVEIVTGVSDKAVYEMVLTPEKVGYSGLSDESLIKIEVWIENQSNIRVSEIRTYIIDYSYYEHTRYFIFRNSLGAFEVIRGTGLMVKSDDYSRETAAVSMDSEYTSKDREMLSVNNIEQQTFSISLGWLSRYAVAGEEFRNWLKDFALSKEIYQVSGNTLIPICINSKSIERGKDRDNLLEFSFEFVNAFTDEHFTKELTWNLLDESFNTDFEVAQ